MYAAPHTPTLSSEMMQLLQQRNVLTSKTKARVINDLERHTKEDREYEKQQLKSHAIEEIYSSELSYLNQLEVTMKFFRGPLSDCKLPVPNRLKALLDNLVSIYFVNGELLTQLKIHCENVAEAFKTVAPFFKVYSVYAYGYRHGITSLQELAKSNPKLDALIRKQETRPEVAMKLGSLLIAPIQRLPRYRLLLKELLHYTSPNDPQYLSILEAIKEVEKVTEHINSLVSEQENMDRILELQKSLVGGTPVLVKPGRKLIKEGILSKVSKKGNKTHQRYFILLSDILVYCKMTGALFGESNSLRSSCVFPLIKCSVFHQSQKSFQIVCGPVSVTLSAGEPCTVEDWLICIEKAILEEKENRQTLKRRGSKRYLKKRDVDCSTQIIPTKRKRLEERVDHSPPKRNKISFDSSYYMDISTELEELRPKWIGYFSSMKKAISFMGQSTINKFWDGMNRHRNRRR